MSSFRPVLGGLALIAVWLIVAVGLRALFVKAGEHRFAVVLVATMATMATLPAALGRLVDGIILPTVFVGVLGLVLRVVFRQQLESADESASTLPLHLWAKILGALALVLTAWTAIQGHYWDENSTHFTLASTIARGVLPPEHGLFPGEVFRYHYGYDVLAAQVRAFTGIGVASALDVVTICVFALLLYVAGTAGRTLAGRTLDGRTLDGPPAAGPSAAGPSAHEPSSAGRLGASLAIILVPLGSGVLQHLLFRDFGALELHWDALPKAWLQNIPPPVISNYFQHPQGTGMPLALGLLLLFDGTEDERQRPLRVAIGAVVLGMCSLVHIVFFGVLGLALGASVLVQAARTRRFKAAALELVALALALVIARILGGFLEPGGQAQNLLTFKKDFFNEPMLTRLWHLVVLFGVPLVALPFAFFRAREKPVLLRTSLLVGATVGFLVPNIMTYERSWDIVKFLGIAAFFSNLLLADTLTRFFEKMSWPKAIRATAVAVLVVLATSTAWLWLFRSSVLDGRIGIPRMHFGGPSQVCQEVARRLDPVAQPRDRVMSTNIDMSKVGYLTPGFSWRQFGAGYMIDRKAFERLQSNLRIARRTLGKAQIEALGVRWLVLSPGDVGSLSEAAKSALSDPKRFEHQFDVTKPDGKRHVYKVVRKNAD